MIIGKISERTIIETNFRYWLLLRDKLIKYELNTNHQVNIDVDIDQFNQLWIISTDINNGEVISRDQLN